MANRVRVCVGKKECMREEEIEISVCALDRVSACMCERELERE